MGTAQDVIKKFMGTLGDTSSIGVTALDEATRASSSYSSWQDVINNMVTDAKFYKEHNIDSATFLREKCGINLDNDDTGAITGFDAGNGIVKTRDSIVPEDGPYQYPTSSTSTFSGLTVHWPDVNSLTESQKLIIGGLNSWWIPNSLNLIKESYGLSFENSNPSTNEITVRFPEAKYFPTDWSQANFNGVKYQQDSQGIKRKVTYLPFNLNPKYFDGVSPTDPNGTTSTINYVDSLMAHEMTHAVMYATIDGGLEYFPAYFREGAADLTRGSDKEKSGTIKRLAGDPAALSKVYQDDYTGTDVYGGGYMLLRYFAKNAADRQLPDGAQVFGTDMNLLSHFNNEIWLDGKNVFTGESKYKNDSIINVDGSKITGDALLAGNMQNNVISGGSGNTSLWGGDYGDDVLIGGSGRDTFYFGKYEGNDVIQNISGNDTINLFDVNLSDFANISVNDNDIFFAFNQGGKLTIQGGRNAGNTFFLGEEGTTWRYDNGSGNWLQL